MARRPPTVICYLCGREFGSSSISIHEPQCLKKWKLENSLLPRQLRRKPPVKPQNFSITSTDPRERQIQMQMMNDMAYESAKLQLIPCQNCGRTFLPDRLPVHLRSCKGSSPGKLSNNFKAGVGGSQRGGMGGNYDESGYERSSPKTPQKPRTVVCYICGREFGTKSIDIHEPQCMKKWHMENSQLPKQMRRPMPVKPNIFPSLSGDGASDRERMNQLAYESSKKQLIPCENCGRTFLPERLSVHQKSCRPSAPTKSFISKGFNVNSPRLSPNSPSSNGCGGKFSPSENQLNQSGFSPASSPRPPSKPLVKAPSKSLMKTNSKANITQKPSSASFNKTAGVHFQKKPGLSSSASRGNMHSGGYGSAGQAKSGGSFGGENIPIGRNAGYNMAEAAEMEEPLNLVPCGLCGRSFDASRLQKHQNVCAKTASKQRKVFDSTKMRTTGTEMAQFNRRGLKPEPAKPKSNWRKQHEEFISAVRDAKKVQTHISKGGKVSDLPPPKYSENAHYVYCRFCTRKFAPEVAERHIPKCQSTLNRPAPPKKRANAAPTYTRKYGGGRLR